MRNCTKSEGICWIAGVWKNMRLQYVLKTTQSNWNEQRSVKLVTKFFDCKAMSFPMFLYTQPPTNTSCAMLIIFVLAALYCVHETASLLSNYNFAHNMPCVISLFLQQTQVLPFTLERSLVLFFFCSICLVLKVTWKNECISPMHAWFCGAIAVRRLVLVVMWNELPPWHFAIHSHLMQNGKNSAVHKCTMQRQQQKLVNEFFACLIIIKLDRSTDSNAMLIITSL